MGARPCLFFLPHPAVHTEPADRDPMDRILTHHLFTWFLYHLIRLYSLTFRLTVVNEASWMAHLDDGGRILLCTWHQQFFSAIRHFQRYREFEPGIMISQSKDGEIIAGVARRSGWRPVRGSSSTGGRAAMRAVIRQLTKTRLAGHIVDGPRGPAGVVKPGVIRMAQLTRSAIVPMFVSVDRAWFFNSWDRFMLPKPFARVTLRFGDMIPIQRSNGDEAFEHQRRTLERVMRPGLIS